MNNSESSNDNSKKEKLWKKYDPILIIIADTTIEHKWKMYLELIMVVFLFILLQCAFMNIGILGDYPN